MRPRLLVVLGLCSVAALVLTPAAGGAPAKGPRYTNFHAPGEDARRSAEPSIGVNRKTNAVMYQAGTQTYQVSFDDKRKQSEWTDVTAPLEGVVTLDPILFTDAVTGRTFVSQLLLACSLLSYTDDDGETWTPTEGCGPGALFDHQSVASGPYAETLVPAPSTPVYPHAVYYCSQAVADASCARSDNGGLTFGPGVPMYTIAQCDGLHGHMRIGPDGTAYVPHFSCGGKHAAVVSEDNGVTWSIRKIDESEANGESDDSVAIGAGGTVYYGWQDGDSGDDNVAKVAVSHDKGRTWKHIIDVGKKLGVRNVQFPEMIAGDDDRAAFAFLGSKTGGDDQTNDFKGSWRLYISTTYDGGRTWTTVDVNPKEIVQRGCIKLTTCSDNYRNLLDFNDIAVDKYGRVLVAWADGCNVLCEQDPDLNTFAERGVITRQTSGRTLFKKYDRMFS